MAGSVEHVTLVVVRVGDLAASRAFYERLGLAFQVEQHGSGPEHLSADLGGTVIELYPQGSGPRSTGTRLGFAVASVDAVLAAVPDGTEVPRDGGRTVVVVDPDGHRVELTEPARSGLPPQVEHWHVAGRFYDLVVLTAPDRSELELDDVGPGLGRGTVARATVPDEGAANVELVDGARLPLALVERFVAEVRSTGGPSFE
ncbi:MAG TPA: VOC family protein [Acidimicrobiales bacterium]|nr:VOC family protein [Acidimicrobiales bacterium]